MTLHSSHYPNKTALASLIDLVEDRVLTPCGGIVHRITTLPPLGLVVTSTLAVLMAFCNTSAIAQVGFGPVRPALTAEPAPVVVQVVSQADPLLTQLDTAIDITSRRYLVANSHSPWQIFHGLLALKRDFQLSLGSNQKISAIQWISTAEPQFDKQPLLMKTAHGGKFHAFTRPMAFEGHPAQFLALLSQSDLPMTHQFKVGNGYITIRDVVNNTMKEVNTREEVTWVLWSLQHYLPTSAQWVNQQNEAWSIERLVQIETNAPVVGAPCGGNHRLFALTRTRDKHLASGGRLDGVWAQADYKIRQHVEIARSLQNSDGTFSSRSYEAPGTTNDLNERLATSGHTMEFLSIGLPTNRLNEQWVRNAVMMLSNELVVNRQREISCGPLYHTLNSLIIYRERIRAISVPVAVPVPVAKAEDLKIPLLSPLPSLPKGPSADNRLQALPVTTKLPPLTGSPDAKSPVAGLPPLNSTLEAPQALAAPIPVQKPSNEALNELTLDKSTRDLLNSLRFPNKMPAEVPDDSDAKPLASADRPLDPQIILPPPLSEEPVSALEPANQ